MAEREREREREGASEMEGDKQFQKQQLIGILSCLHFIPKKASSSSSTLINFM